jgi:hypothetical protein
MIRIWLILGQVDERRNLISYVPERASYHNHQQTDADQLLTGMDPLFPSLVLFSLQRGSFYLICNYISYQLIPLSSVREIYTIQYSSLFFSGAFLRFIRVHILTALLTNKIGRR